MAINAIEENLAAIFMTLYNVIDVSRCQTKDNIVSSVVKVSVKGAHLKIHI